MDYDIQLDIKNIPKIKSVRRRIEKEIAYLNSRFEGIKNCHVTVDLPYHHRYPGNIYNFRIEVSTPDEKITITRGPSINAEEENIFTLIHEAFDEMNQKLRNCACEKLISDESSDSNSQKSTEHLYERASKPSDIKSESRV